MRNPNRIPRILEQLGEEWKKVPDWRLGQFLVNFLSWYGRDPFFIEDDDFIKLVQEYMEKEITG